MFEHLKPYKRILVTGPQRSGTTICARAIAYDIGFLYVDEDEIGIDDIVRATALYKHQERFVLQAPGLAHACHLFNGPDNAVVFMMRDIGDIIRSEKRIDWGREKTELAKYGVEKGPIAQIKYERWQEQKKRILNPIEVEYTGLVGHPLWIAKEKRGQFKARQWQA